MSDYDHHDLVWSPCFDCCAVYGGRDVANDAYKLTGNTNPIYLVDKHNLAELDDDDDDDEDDDDDDEADIDQRVFVCASRLRQIYDAGPLGIVENGIRYIHRDRYELLSDAP